jgi:hypothetical protein
VATLKFGDGTEMTTAASGGGSTSTYYNLTVTNELVVGPADGLGQLRLYRDGTNGLSIGSTDPGNDYLMINNQRWIYLNPTSTPGDSSAVIISEQDPQFSILRVNTITPISTYTNVEIAATLTVQKATIGLNTGTTWRDFGYGNMPYNANNMKIELPNNGSSLFFAFKNPGGAARNIGFSRQGHIVLQQGGIFNATPNGLSLQANDGGQVFVGVNTNTNGVIYTSRLGANTSTGVFQIVQTNAGVNFSTLLDYNGTFTVPRDLVVTTTATVASLSVTNTATANEVVVGADLNAIKSQGYNVIGVDGNWHVGNVLEVGTGDGNGYITSTGNNTLKLQTSGNNGPGGSIDIGYGDGAGVSLYSGNSQEFNVASFNTTSNTINYGLTVNGPATFTSPTTLAVFTATGLTAITGSVGQIAIVSNSGGGGGNVNGMMAFWDTTNSRWSYVHDNSAV